MRMTRAWFALRRVLIGANCGAVIGFALHYLVVEPQGSHDPNLGIAFVAIVSTLGALAGGFLSTTGWTMLAGAFVGGIVAGLCGAALTLHISGLIYSCMGAPIGAVAIFLLWPEQNARNLSPGASASPAQSGVWDRELDL